MRVLIVEDETLVARRLERLMAQLEPASALTLAGGLHEAVTSLRAGGVDLVLLDLNLGGEDGFSLAEQLRLTPCPVIVISGSTERAIEGFEHGIVDFVPKPFTEARLAAALDRYRAMRRGMPPTHLIIVDRGRRTFVPHEEIMLIRGADDYSEVALANGRQHLHNETLAALAGRLPHSFLRVHRSAIVNRRFVREARRRSSGGYELILVNGEEIAVGRSYAGVLLGSL